MTISFVALATVTIVAATTPAAAGNQGAVRACVARWNWIPIRYVVTSGSERAAVVLAHPCRVFVYYNGGPRDPEFWNWVPCWIDQFNVYACGVHAEAVKPPSGAFSSPNASYRLGTGTIRLRGEAEPPTTPKPDWVRRWHWDNGFIVPFDPEGRVLPGIKVKHQYNRAIYCGPTISHSVVGYCGAGGIAIYARWPARKGDRVAFTGTVLAGTTSYDMFRAP